jgi:hypothetical protein
MPRGKEGGRNQNPTKDNIKNQENGENQLTQKDYIKKLFESSNYNNNNKILSLITENFDNLSKELQDIFYGDFKKEIPKPFDPNESFNLMFFTETKHKKKTIIEKIDKQIGELNFIGINSPLVLVALYPKLYDKGLKEDSYITNFLAEANEFSNKKINDECSSSFRGRGRGILFEDLKGLAPLKSGDQFFAQEISDKIYEGKISKEIIEIVLQKLIISEKLEVLNNSGLSNIKEIVKAVISDLEQEAKEKSTCYNYNSSRVKTSKYYDLNIYRKNIDESMDLLEFIHKSFIKKYRLVLLLKKERKKLLAWEGETTRIYD